MNMHKRTVGNAIIVARIAAVIVAFLFAHDLMMTAMPHHAGAESVHHELVVVEECGNTEGVPHSASGTSFELPASLGTPVVANCEYDPGVGYVLDPTDVDCDASTRRALLQVFLN